MNSIILIRHVQLASSFLIFVCLPIGMASWDSSHESNRTGRLEHFTQDFQSERSIRSVSHKTDHVQQFCRDCTKPDIGKCETTNLIRIRKYTKTLKCKPVPTIVKLKLPGPDYSVEPPYAKINRCSGHCGPSFHSCLPAQTSFITVPVILTQHSTRATKCVEYEVEQHESCTCGCNVLKEHCSERHKHENCSCQCVNELEMVECIGLEAHHRKKWDEERCECICRPEVCPYGLTWDTQECRCTVRMTSDAVENLLY